MLDVSHELTLSSTIGSQLIGDDTFRRTTLFLQKPNQQTLCCLGVAAGLAQSARSCDFGQLKEQVENS